MTGAPSADFPLLVSRSAAGTVIADALRLYVGRGRRYSVKQLSNATGVKDRVIECAMAGPENTDFRPMPPEALLSIALFLGPEFSTDWLAVAKQAAFALPDTDETPPGDLAADNSDDNAVVTRAAVDGKFDAEERPVLRMVGKRMMCRGAQLAHLQAVSG